MGADSVGDSRDLATRQCGVTRQTARANNRVAGVGVSVRVPILPGWESGPAAELQGADWRACEEVFGLYQPDQIRLYGGLELRQDFLRRR